MIMVDFCKVQFPFSSVSNKASFCDFLSEAVWSLWVHLPIKMVQMGADTFKKIYFFAQTRI
jgi:hypothetical protein